MHPTHPTNMSKVFITGATGYIGGEVLYQLLDQHTDLEIYAVVRSQAKADDLVKKTGNKVTPVIGDLDNLEFLSKYVGECDVIINTANVDHVPSAQAISDVLVALKTPKILIHTSGTSVIGDEIAENKPTPKVYYDDKSIDDINSLPMDQAHRPVDKIVLDINEKNPLIKTAIVCPSTIFGVSKGYGRTISIQIPYMMTLAIQNKQTSTVYHGNYIWSHVHISDLGELYLLILKKFLDGEDIPQGSKGYYFGAYVEENEVVKDDKPSSIEHTWRDVANKVSELLYARGLIDTPEVNQATPEYIIKIKQGDEFAPYFWGQNSRSRANNGFKIGWKPKHVSLDDFYASFNDDIDVILKEGMADKELPRPSNK